MNGVFLTEATWQELGDEVDAVAPGHERLVYVPGERVPPEVIERITVASLSSDLWDGPGPFLRVCLDAPQLRWLHTFSAGVDHPVFGMFLGRGVRLTTSSGASAPAIAHHVLMVLLAMRRDLPGFLRDQAARRWAPRDVGDVEGTRLGVVGMGPIGTETARLALELGMRVTGVRRRVRGDEPCETWAFDRLEELLPAVDALVLAVPLTPDTRHLLDARTIALLRPGAHLVNVGRGELVDEPALVDSLRSGHVGFAALDVTAVEPLPAESPLWGLDNVIITPHSSGSTRSTRARALRLFVDNLGRYVRSEALVNEVHR